MPLQAHRSDRNGIAAHRLRHHVIAVDRAVLVDLSDPRFDVAEPELILPQRFLDLGALHHQHAAQLGGRNPVIEQRADLLERQAELLERENAVETRQLPDAVVSIAGLAVGARRLQQPKLAVEPKLAA